MRTLEQLATTGLRGAALSEAIHRDALGSPPAPPAAERTPEERRTAMERFFAIMESMTDEELADNPLEGRPLNVSILEEPHPSDANAA